MEDWDESWEIWSSGKDMVVIITTWTHCSYEGLYKAYTRISQQWSPAPASAHSEKLLAVDSCLRKENLIFIQDIVIDWFPITQWMVPDLCTEQHWQHSVGYQERKTKEGRKDRQDRQTNIRTYMQFREGMLEDKIIFPCMKYIKFWRIRNP